MEQTKISHKRIIAGIFDDMTGAFQEEVPSIFPRKDVHSEDPFSMYQEIYQEGQRLAGTDIVELADGRQILVFNSVAASPHTLFRVPYHDYEIDMSADDTDKDSPTVRQKFDGFKSIFKRHAAEAGYLEDTEFQDPNHECILIEKDGKEQAPEVAPLDMLVWTMMRDSDGRIKPIDISDFASPPTGDKNIDHFRLQLDDDKMKEVYGHVMKRVDLSGKVLLEIYNNNIRAEIPFLPEKTEKDLLQGVAIGFYRGDTAKMLEQFKYDGLGKGPMSNPSTHFRVTMHLAMETIRDLRRLDAGISLENVIDYIRYKEVDGELERTLHFAENIHMHEVTDSKMKRAPNYKTESELLKDLIQPGNIPPIELLKLIDPYASVAHDLLSGWLVEKLQTEFSDLEATIEPFAHHAGLQEREMRASEGVELLLRSADPKIREEALTRITRIVGETFSPLWEDIKSFVTDKMLLTHEEQDTRLNDLQKQYGLPQEVLAVVKRLLPTEKQMHNLLHTVENPEHLRRINSALHGYGLLKAQHELEYRRSLDSITSGKGTRADLTNLISSLQALQLFDDWNEGYNVPGVPSFGITFSREEENQTKISLGWLLSMKGLAELWLGAMVIREKKDSGS